MTRGDDQPGDDPFTDWLVERDLAIAEGDAVKDRLPSATPDKTTSSGRQAEADALLVRLDQLRQARASAAASILAQRSSADAASSPKRIGRFEIVQELGRGGCGIVFLAVDPQLGRQIALKVPRPEALVSDDLRDRFLREARSAALLDHPNLVPVYEGGRAGPIWYVASAYVAGETLAEHLHRRPALMPPRQAAALVAALADAVQHAHERGILHRDIKPSNVLLDQRVPTSERREESEREPVPRLADFGMAKLLDGDAEATRTGLLVGTPSYMAPEQAAGKKEEIGPQTDVYGLGALLYEMLAGRSPLRGESEVDTLRRTVVEEPTPPRRDRPEIPADLEAICLKCLEKSPAARYASAATLAADLRRFLSGVPTWARPLGRVAKLDKWIRRRPALAALIAVTTLSLLVGLAGSMYYNVQLNEGNQQLRQAVQRADQQREMARQEAARSRRLLYAVDIQLAAEALEAENIAQVDRLLERQIPEPGQEDLREFAWHYLWGITHNELVTLSAHDQDAFAVAFSPDGQLLATAGKDGTAKLWDVKTWQPLGAMVGHASSITSVAFSPRGDLLATGSKDHTVRLWNVASRTPVATLSGHADHVLAVAFSPDGRRLASGGRDQTVAVWNVASTERMATFTSKADVIRGLAFSPAGETLAAGDEEGWLWTWDVASGRQNAKIHLDQERFFAVDWATGSNVIAATGRRGNLELFSFDRDAGKLINSAGKNSHPVWSEAVAFSPVSPTVATGGKDSIVNVWTYDDELELTKALRCHTSRVRSVVWSPDGRLLAAAAGDGTVKIWEIAKCHHRPVRHPRLRKTMRAAAFFPDGKTVATGTRDGVVQLWDVSLPTPAVRRSYQLHPSEIVSLSVTADGQLGVSRCRDGITVAWETATGSVRWTARGEPSDHHAATVSSDGQLVAAVSDENVVQVSSLTTGSSIAQFVHDDFVKCVAFSPDGKLLATSSDRVRLWSVETGEAVKTFAAGEHVTFTNDGSCLATDHQLSISVWDVETGRRRVTMDGHRRRINALAFSPDDKTLVSGGQNIRFWDVRTGQELLSFNGGAYAAWDFVFSPDGMRLMAASSTASKGRLVEWGVQGRSMAGTE